MIRLPLHNLDPDGSEGDVAQIVGGIVAFAPGMDAEQVRDIIGSALVAGANVTITVDDAADTITIASTAKQVYPLTTVVGTVPQLVYDSNYRLVYSERP
jgi:hypothetical protein